MRCKEISILAVAGALLVGCSSGGHSSPKSSGPPATVALAENASGLLAHDQAAASLAGQYANALDGLSADCTEPEPQVALMVDVAVDTLHGDGSHETRLAFMTTLGRLTNGHTSVDCTSAALDLQTALDPTMGTPSTPASIPLGGTAIASKPRTAEHTMAHRKLGAEVACCFEHPAGSAAPARYLGGAELLSVDQRWQLLRAGRVLPKL